MIAALVLAAHIAVTPEMPVAPEVIRNAANLQVRPAVASNGAEFFAAWETKASTFGTTDVLGTRIGANGEIVDRYGGITLQPMWVPDRDPSIVWNGSTYMVMIAEGVIPWPYGIKGVEVTADGLVVNEKLVVSPRHVEFVDVAWNGSLYLVAWRQSDDHSVRAQRFDRALQPVGQELLFASEAGVDVAVASNGVDFMVAWRTIEHAFASRVTSGSVIPSAVDGSPDRTAVIPSAVEGSPDRTAVIPSVVEGSPACRGCLDFARHDSAPLVIARAPSAIDISSNGVSYAIYTGEEIVAVDAITQRVTMPASSEIALAWNGLQWVAVWSANERVYVTELDATLQFTRAPERLVLEESVQRTPAVATSAGGTIVVWSDGSDIRSAFVGNPGATALVSQGVPHQRPAGAAWSAHALGVVWNEEDVLRFGRFSRDGAPLDGEGIALAAATSARIASNGESWAIAAERNGRIDVDVIPSAVEGSPSGGGSLDFAPEDTVTVGTGTDPWIASNGRDYYVVWQSARGEISGRTVSASGALGPARILPPVTSPGVHLIHGVAWDRERYLVLTNVVGGFRYNFYSFIATPVSAAGDVGAYVNIATSASNAGSNARIAETEGEPLIVWSLPGEGVRMKRGLTGEVVVLDEQPLALLETAWDGRELLLLLNIEQRLVLQRGNERVTLDLPGQARYVFTAAPGRRAALLYHRAFERIPGFPALSTDRGFVRFVLPPIRRRAVH